MISLKNISLVLMLGWSAFSCAMDMDYPGSSTKGHYHSRHNDDDDIIDPHGGYWVSGTNPEDAITAQKPINPHRNPTSYEEVVQSTQFQINSLLKELQDTEKKKKDIILQINDQARIGSAALAKTRADGMLAKL